MKVLLLEGIHPAAVELLEHRGFEVDLLHESLSEDALIQALPGVDMDCWTFRHIGEWPSPRRPWSN